MREIESNYTFPTDHPALEGHFPGNPVIPGVLILDKVLDSVKQLCPSDKYTLPMVKFLQPLIPPASLTVCLSSQETGRIEFIARNGKSTIATGVIQRQNPTDD